MTYIQLSNDMSLAITQKEDIYRGDNMSSAITFLIPLTASGIEVKSATVYLCYILPNGIPDIVTLYPETEMYNDSYYKYTIPVTCKLSMHSGDVCMWLEFYSGNMSCPAVKKTGECTLSILEKQGVDGCMSDHQLTAIYQMQRQLDDLKENGVYSKQVQSDYNQNDPDAPDYIKNRLAYSIIEETETIVVPEIFIPELAPDELQYGRLYFNNGKTNAPIEAGKTYVVHINDDTYSVVAYSSADFDGVMLGNGSFLNVGYDTGEHFAAHFDGVEVTFYTDEGMKSCSVAEKTVEEVVFPIDQKFIPDTIANADYVNKKVAIVKEDTLAMAKSYTDSQRLGYIETKRKTIIPETVVVVNEETPLNFVPVVGEKYTIVIDGTVYEDTAVLERITGAGDAVCLGNDLLFSENDTEQPFFIAYLPAAQICAVNVLAGDGENATISIYQETETIHPIDPKFLPDTVATKADIFGAMEASY